VPHNPIPLPICHFTATRSIIGSRSDGSCGLKREFIFYIVVGNIIAVIAGVAGASLPVILFSALLIPPVLLIIIRIVR